MTILKAVFYTIVIATAFVATVMLGMSVRAVRYDCSLAEISPDFPVEVKNQCRNMYRQHYEQNEK
jgi:hypothetical protein